MKVLGLDFETTGLDASQCRVIEIGAAVWDTDGQKPLAILSELLQPEGLSEIPADSAKIHGITMEMLKTYGVPAKEGFLRLIRLMESCDYVVAHNAPFERSFLETEIKSCGLDFDFKKILWVDTMTDLPYPEHIQTRKLNYIAAEHGIINHHAHRAITDVLVMLGVFGQYPIEGVIERSKSPSVQVIAKVSFDEKDKAKNLGFHWNPKNKTWFKEFKEMDLAKVDFPFQFDVQPF